MRAVATVRLSFQKLVLNSVVTDPVWARLTLPHMLIHTNEDLCLGRHPDVLLHKGRGHWQEARKL